LFILLQGIITIATIIITITIAIAYVLSTTTATEGTPFDICLPPHQKGATSCYDCNLVVAGQYYASLAIEEQSGGRKTSSF